MHRTVIYTIRDFYREARFGHWLGVRDNLNIAEVGDTSQGISFRKRCANIVEASKEAISGNVNSGEKRLRVKDC